MTLKFSLETQGWMRCSAKDEIGNECIIAHSSDYKDGFQELISELFFIDQLISKKDTDYFPYESVVHWCDEIRKFSIQIKVNSISAKIDMEIIESSVHNPEYSKHIFACSADLSDIFSQLLNSLDEIIATHGIVGYKTIWETGNFPIAEYLILKNGFFPKKLMPQELNDSDTSFNQEIHFLNNLLNNR